jgi:dTDP-4-amino-4,6-dideoxy-D-galactose acyltransferase
MVGYLMDYQLLEWDTNFFGIKVARITVPNLSIEKLAYTLTELKHNGFTFIYWPASQEYNQYDIDKLGGLLVDLKTTFRIDLSSAIMDESLMTDIVSPYSVSMQMEDLESLAVQSGQFSRFATDPHLSIEQFIMLYKIWVNRSLRKEIAKEVLVIEEGGHAVGMVTLTEKEGRGNIGLIAVDESSRGKKYGETLVRAGQKWFVKNGYKIGQVVTQGKNISACNLYLKCGYSVEKVEYFYHFWL